jgi:N-acetylneuraminic acid mutarotase
MRIDGAVAMKVALLAACLALAGCIGGVTVESKPPAREAGGSVQLSADPCPELGLAAIPSTGGPWGSVDVEAHLPESLGHLYGSGAAYDGKRTWIFGGYMTKQPGQPKDTSGTPSNAILSYAPGQAVAELEPHKLPAANWDMAAQWTGGAIYLFGGQNGNQHGIVKFDPSTGLATTLPAKLPHGGGFMASAWDGKTVYLFGGGLASDRIMAFTPGTETLRTLDARLPTPRQGSMAAFDGSDIYVFGGKDRTTGLYKQDILRFNPKTGSLATLPALLPTPLAYGAAAWDGRQVVILGGIVADNPAPGDMYVRTPTIFTYQPMAPAVRVYPMWLPQAPSSIAAISDGGGILVFSPWEANGASEIWRVRLPLALPFESEPANAAWQDGVAYVFGGGTSDAIRKYDPRDGRLQEVAARLPSPRNGAMAAAVGKDLYVLGGVDLQGRPMDEILRYNPAKGTVEKLAQGLPEGLACAGIVAQANRLVVLGGIRPDGKVSDGILIVDTSTEKVTTATARLPEPMAAIQAGHDGETFVVMEINTKLRVTSRLPGI